MYLLVSLITAFVNILLGLFAYLKNPKSSTNRLLAILTIIISLWTITNYFSLNSASPSDTLFWIKIVMAVTAGLGPVVFLLVKSYPDVRLNLPKAFIIGLFFYVLITIFLALSPFMFQSVSIQNGNIQPVPGPAIIVYAIGFLGSLIAAFITTIIKYKKSTGLIRVQMKYLLLGIIFTFTCIAITNFIFVVVLKISSFVVLGPSFSLIFITCITYSIVKHRFLDIHLIVARSVSYVLLLILLAIIYIFGFIMLAIFVTQEQLNITNLISSAIFTFVLIFSFQPFRKILEKITAKTFYKQMYSSQTVLWNMSRIMASTVSISDISEGILKELTHQMSIRNAAIILTRDSNIIWTKEVGTTHFPQFNEKSICGILNTIVKTSKEHILIFDEMYESPEKKIMRDHHISVLLALILQEEVIGAIVLSEKASGDIYSLEDISILKILGPEISVAVKNSLSYDEIKRFNNTLQQEVSKATDEVKKANEQMYKRNLDLAERNKTLSLLRKIDDAILTTVTNTKQIAQRVADMIIYESQIRSILIVLVDQEEKKVFEVATAPSSIMHNIEENFKRDLKGVGIPFSETENLIISSIHNKGMHITDNIYQIVRPLFSEKEASKLQELIGAKSHVVYPMIVHGSVIGAMVMGLHQEYVSLSDHQKDLISRLVSVMGIAIDNALLYQKIADANERLKQLDLLKDEFVSVASHELRTPMTAIKSYLWLALAEKAGPLNEKLRFYLDRSYISTNRLIKLVNDMLNVSRIESGRMNFEIKKTDMVKLVEDTISEVKPRADELGITIVNKFEKLQNIPSSLADEDKIKEVLINLIGNALKFTTKGGSITIWFEQKDNMIITNVTDTGEGIDEADIPKLFQKFGLVKGSYQTNKEASQGTGLGLYICKAIMEEHGGDIWAHSAGHGKGATFSYSLKLFNEKDFEQFKQLVKKNGLGIIHSEV